MTITAGNKADFELPGDLGEHDPRRMEHPLGNEPGSGGHEVKPNSAEVLGEGHNSQATAANNDPHSHPGRDNTAEHALEGGSTETMDRAKRQTAAGHGGLREGNDEPFSRAGHQQQTNTEHVGHHHDQHHGHHHGSNQGQGYDGTSSIRGPGQEGNFNRDQEYSRQPNVTGEHHGHHHHNEGGALGSTGQGFSNRDQYQSGSEPISGHRGAGVAGEPYDAGNIQEPGLGGAAPQHSSHFGGSHNTRAGELLDPASGRETGIPGYAAGHQGHQGHHGHHESGLTGSNTTGSGLTGSNTAGHSGLTGSNTTGTGFTGRDNTGHSGLTGHDTTGNSGFTGSNTTGSGLTGSNTAGHSGLTGNSGYTGSNTTGNSGFTGSNTTGSGLTGSNTAGHSGLTGNSGYTGSNTTGNSGLTGHDTTGHSGLTGSNTTGNSGLTGHDTTGNSGYTGSNTTGNSGVTGRDTVGSNTTDSNTATKASKPSLLDRLNPMKDTDHDGKKGFMD